MKRKLLELFDDLYNALDELLYSQMISCETFRELDSKVKTPLTEIFHELNEEDK